MFGGGSPCEELLSELRAEICCISCVHQLLFGGQGSTVIEALYYLHFNFSLFVIRNVRSRLGQDHQRLRAIGHVERALEG